jgi:hypothetical protein
VIIDICEPFKFEDKEQFVTKVKIIDPTFNFQAYITNKDIKFHKFVTVHLYSDTVEQAPKAKNVGDLIRLRRFHFCLSDKGELIAFETSFSNWIIYKGNKGDVMKGTNHKMQWDEKNSNRTLTKYEGNRIVELRDWAAEFFAQHKIKFITWWSPLIEPANEKEAVKDRVVSTDVDIILKATEVNAKENTIHFVDHGNKNYLLTLRAPPVLQQGKVIKLRCVNVIYAEDIRVLQLTQKSSCLVVPDHFFDAVEFRKKGSSPKQSVAKTPQRFSKTPEKSAAKSKTPERKVTPAPSAPSKSKSPTPVRAAKSDFTSEYDLPTGKKGSESLTAIKKSCGKMKTTSIRDLLDILEDPHNYQNRRFLVKGYILGFSEDKLSGIVKKMAGDKVMAFDAKGKGVSKYIFHFTINLKDSSVEDTEETLNAYVLTNDGDQHLFDNWGLLPGATDVEAWENLPKAKVSAFEKKFASLKNGHHEGKFVVELLITASGKPFFKVYDTIFA